MWIVADAPVATTPALATLLTPRLSLRAVADADLSDLYDIHSDEVVTRYLPFAPWAGYDDGRAWIARMRGLVDSGQAQQRVLQKLGSGKVIGTALLFAFDRDDGCAEIGYVVGQAHWGHGYMREALRALCSHAFATSELGGQVGGQVGGGGLRRLQANIDPNNTQSTGLIERLGFVREGTLRERWLDNGRPTDCAVYGLLAKDWISERN